MEIKHFAEMGTASATPATLKVSVATSPDKTAIIQELSSNPISGNTYIEYTSTFTAAAEGVYYFGFGNVTPSVAETGSLRIDNIRFTSTNLAVSTIDKDQISVYPNPVVDYVNIKSSEKIDKVEVFSTEGKLIKTEVNVNRLNFGKIPKGIYLLRIFTKSGIQTQKVIK